MCPDPLPLAVTVLASSLAEGRSTEEISLLAAVLTQLGDTLATIAAQNAFCHRDG